MRRSYIFILPTVHLASSVSRSTGPARHVLYKNALDFKHFHCHGILLGYFFSSCYICQSAVIRCYPYDSHNHVMYMCMYVACDVIENAKSYSPRVDDKTYDQLTFAFVPIKISKRVNQSTQSKLFI